MRSRSVWARERGRVWRALVDAEERALWLMPNDFVLQVGRQFTMECGEPIGRRLDEEAL